MQRSAVRQARRVPSPAPMVHIGHMQRRTLWINLALGGALLLAVIVLMASLLPRPSQDPGRTVTAELGTVTATVTANGTVERSGTVDLAFRATGTVTEVSVQAGDSVRAGQVLARVQDAAAQQQLASAQSTLVQAMSNAQGSANSTATAQQALADAIALADATNVRNEQAVIQAKSNLQATQDAWSDACLDINNPACPNPAAQAQLRAAQNAVTSGQQAYDNAVATAVQNEIGYTLTVNQRRVSSERATAERISDCDTYGASSSSCQSANSAELTAQQSYETALNSRTAGLLADQQAMMTASMTLSDAQVALQRTQADLRKANADAVRTAKQALTNAKQAYEIGLISGRQSVNQARTSLNTAQQSNAEMALADGQVLSANQAAIESAQALVAAAEQGVADTTIVAPIDGIVGSVSYVVGESAGAATTSGTPGITLLPKTGLEVLAEFAEADAARVTVGDRATVTFAALAGTTSQGTVLAVDEVATTGANALVTYGVRVAVTDPPEGVREGMTASVTVTVEEATDVIFLPPGVVTERDGGAYVLAPLAEGGTKEIPVTLGLKGDIGTEITGGLAVGDVVVVPEAQDGAAQFPPGGVPGESS